MPINLKLNQPSYSLYCQSASQYIYFSGGDWTYSGVPKASGMFATIDKITLKRDKLLITLTKWATESRYGDSRHGGWEAGKPGPFLHVSEEAFQKIKDDVMDAEKARYQERLETARKFIIVKLEVTEV